VDELTAIACCYEGCGASVCFTPELETRLRKTHEFWMCPFGHSQHFTKLTPQEIELREVRRMRDMWRGKYEETETEFGTCPFCGFRSFAGIDRRWMFMLKHLHTYHGITAPDGVHPVTLLLQAREKVA
jgi:hypothetical protein